MGYLLIKVALFLCIIGLSKCGTEFNPNNWFPFGGGGGGGGGGSNGGWNPFWPPNRNNRPRRKKDCEWGDWEGEKCIRKKDGNYVIVKTRKWKKAQGGNKACKAKSETEEEACTVAYYVAQGFMRTVLERSSGGGFADAANTRSILTPFGVKKPTYRNPCAPDVNDGGLRMKGKKCDTKTRRRRNADGQLEFYQEQVKPRMKRQTGNTIKTLKQRDVLFLIDESGSVGEVNFMKEMRMVKAVTNALCGSVAIGQHTTRVGIMTFDRYQNPHMNFNSYDNKLDVASAIDRISLGGWTDYGSGATCMVDALNFTKTDMFTLGRGSRIPLPGKVDRMIIMITDGCANCAAWTKEGFSDEKIAKALESMSASLADEEISVVTFYIGPDDECVERVNALSDGSHCYQVFAVKSWDEFELATRSIIERKECMAAWEFGRDCSDS